MCVRERKREEREREREREREMLHMVTGDEIWFTRVVLSLGEERILRIFWIEKKKVARRDPTKCPVLGRSKMLMVFVAADIKRKKNSMAWHQVLTQAGGLECK